MVTGITPNCRYGHGDLVLARPPEAGPKPGPPNDRSSGFFVPVILGFGQVNFGAGYVFELWRCTQCSYLEQPDREPVTEGTP
jgi:hypothetical protein